MRLIKARVQGYRSIIDSGYFDINELKTILVGPNEAGKTAILQAIQKLNPPTGVEPYNVLRDYPRAKYDTDIQKGGVDIDNFIFVEGVFALSDQEKAQLPEAFRNIMFQFGRTIKNQEVCSLIGDVPSVSYQSIAKDLQKLLSYFDMKASEKENSVSGSKPSEQLLLDLNDSQELTVEQANGVIKFLNTHLHYIEDNSKEEDKFNKLCELLQIPVHKRQTLQKCREFLPVFVLFTNYFRVRPLMNLQQLAERTERQNFDDKQYDYGNNCLLKYLGFSARELANLAIPSSGESEQARRDKLDNRKYRLNSASIHLTDVIREIWNPNIDKQEANKIRLDVDGQYLKVVVEDDLGVEVELDQRSEGFQWMVSFFIVFFAEASGKHNNAILLLDEPGMSLHGLKQAEFRKTLSKLSEKNQTIFTTHSPFLVGSNEIDMVRVVELLDRKSGTKVHASLTAGDKAALLPLQEALGYDLAQNLFINERNLILEGITDYWYLEGMSTILSFLGKNGLNEKIAKIPADSASKVVYFATILHAQNLNVVALFDSDASGEQASKQDTLVATLGSKRILRTKDVYNGSVKKCEIEDLIRKTLVAICKDQLGCDVSAEEISQSSRPIVDIIKEKMGVNFSKYKIAKAFLKWSMSDNINQMPPNEVEYCEKLINKINDAF